MQTDYDGNHDALAEISPAVVRALADAHDGIRQFLRHSLRNEDDADDVMQELYVRLLVRSSQLRQKESARAWLRCVLRRVLNRWEEHTSELQAIMRIS